MTKKPGKKELLNQFLETASERWCEELETIRPAIERTVEAIWKVEQCRLKPEEEPLFSITGFHQRPERSTTEQE